MLYFVWSHIKKSAHILDTSEIECNTEGYEGPFFSQSPAVPLALWLTEARRQLQCLDRDGTFCSSGGSVV